MTLLSVERVVVDYAANGRSVRAVDDVSLRIEKDETVGLVGESGCGKSSLGRAIVRLVDPTSGVIRFDGADITQLSGRSLQSVRRRLQMVFQDPYGSLNPRHSIGTILQGALLGEGDRRSRTRIVADMLDRVGLSASALPRYPHEFSGGQRQRISIARALIVAPDLVVCDEPVSALDVSIQAQILNLLVDLKREFGLSYLFISHDLSVVRYLSDRIQVMYLGRTVETAPTDALWTSPLHPYTQALLAAVPTIGGHRADISTRRAPARASDPSPGGCRYAAQCPRAERLCVAERPALKDHGAGHWVACHLA